MTWAVAPFVRIARSLTNSWPRLILQPKESRQSNEQTNCFSYYLLDFCSFEICSDGKGRNRRAEITRSRPLLNLRAGDCRASPEGQIARHGFGHHLMRREIRSENQNERRNENPGDQRHQRRQLLVTCFKIQ